RGGRPPPARSGYEGVGPGPRHRGVPAPRPSVGMEPGPHPDRLGTELADRVVLETALSAHVAKQRLMNARPRAHGIVRLHFGPSPPPAASSVLVQLLTPVSGILWAHALRPSLLPAGVVSLGSRLWLVLLVLWLGTRARGHAG